MSERNWKIVAEAEGYALWRCEEGWSVTGIDRDKGQVYSALPSDLPSDGGWWCARISSDGVSYVSSPRAESTARRWFRQLVNGRAVRERGR